MARPTQLTSSDLTLRLQVSGAMTAQGLADALHVDRSTVARGLGRLGESVVALGAARRARYALRRPVRAVGDRWPVYRVDETGRASEWAQVHALHGGFLIEWAGTAPAWAAQLADREGLVEGFPFFLGDLRPQGFLGRQLARHVAETLRLPADPRSWSDDDTLVFLQAEGVDLPGNLITGEAPMRRVLARIIDPGAATADETIAENACAERYADFAARVSAGEPVGSSAGGEQPKFLTTLRRADGRVQSVLVKFSPPVNTPVGRRWADLLAAESHALAVLAEHGLAPGGARMIAAGGRRFLEVPRYDRVGAQGRRGSVSLEALHGAVATGAAADWPAAAEGFARAELIDAAGLHTVRRLHCFGELIGNSDMHFGNLSFWLDDALPFRPAPAYDMLPMAWAPSVQGELVERAFAPRPPLPGVRPAWNEAAAWAVEFWQRVASDALVSAEFAVQARAAGTQVARMRGLFG